MHVSMRRQSKVCIVRKYDEIIWITVERLEILNFEECDGHIVTGSYNAIGYLQKPSDNFDDTGYFGVQVLTQALKNLGLDLISANSNDPRAMSAKLNPV